MARLDPADDTRLSKLLERLVTYYKPEAVYLFGSRARGDDRPDSDYDLLVVVPDDTPPDRMSLAEAYGVVLTAKVPADVFPCRRSVFETGKEKAGTLAFSAWHEGRQIYGA